MAEVTIHIEGGIYFSREAIEKLIEEINNSIDDNIIIAEEPRDLHQYDDMVLIEVESLYDRCCNWIEGEFKKWLK